MRQLTDIAIRNLPHPPSGSSKHYDPLLPGFGVRCSARSKSFFVMYGKERRIKTLGKWPDMTLKTAREAAKRFQVEQTSHQHTTRRQWRILEARDAFLADCSTRLRPSTVERYRYALAGLTDGPIDDIDTTVSDPNTVKALKAMYNWCIDERLTDRNPFIRRKVRFATRDRLLTDEEIVALWQYEHPPFSDIVKALILSGQRRNQVWKYSESWKQGDTITFPATVMKSDRPHTIPLTRYADYLYPYSFNSWSKAKRRIDKHTGVENWVLHDIRRYFSTTMAKLGVPLHVTEQIIDHRSTVTGVAAIYNLHNFLPEMRDALELYERHVADLVGLD